MRLDLSCVVQILDEARDLAEKLHGQELDESDAVTSQSKGDTRKAKAAMSQDLHVLQDRLKLGEALVADIYWSARQRGADIDTASVHIHHDN